MKAAAPKRMKSYFWILSIVECFQFSRFISSPNKVKSCSYLGVFVIHSHCSCFVTVSSVQLIFSCSQPDDINRTWQGELFTQFSEKLHKHFVDLSWSQKESHQSNVLVGIRLSYLPLLLNLRACRENKITNQGPIWYFIEETSISIPLSQRNQEIINHK